MIRKVKNFLKRLFSSETVITHHHHGLGSAANPLISIISTNSIISPSLSKDSHSDCHLVVIHEKSNSSEKNSLDSGHIINKGGNLK